PALQPSSHRTQRRTEGTAGSAPILRDHRRNCSADGACSPGAYLFSSTARANSVSASRDALLSNTREALCTVRRGVCPGPRSAPAARTKSCARPQVASSAAPARLRRHHSSTTASSRATATTSSHQYGAEAGEVGMGEADGEGSAVGSADSLGDVVASVGSDAGEVPQWAPGVSGLTGLGSPLGRLTGLDAGSGLETHPADLREQNLRPGVGLIGADLRRTVFIRRPR